MEKREARKAARSPSPSIPTFAEAASSVIELRRPIWSNPKHAAQWESTLATYAFPAIGNRPVDRITSGDVLAILTPIWTAKHETASRVRQRMETVFDWTIATGWRLDNPAGKAVLRALPRTSKLKSHHRSLPYGEVPEALRRVGESAADPVTRLSFEFLVLTAARSGEVRKATWSEIDLKSVTWTVPEERMKARREHRVPLSGRCLEILAEARELNRRGRSPHIPGIEWQTPFRHDLRGAAAAGGDTCGGPRVPEQLQELVREGQRDSRPGPPERTGSGPRSWRRDEEGLSHDRPSGRADAVDGSVGRVLPAFRRGSHGRRW